MKLAITNLAWNINSQEKILPFIKDSNFDGIEVAPLKFFGVKNYEDIHNPQLLTKKFEEKYHLKIASLQSIWFGKTETLFSDEKNYDALRNHTKEIIEMAEQMDVSNVVFGSPKNRIVRNEDDYVIAQRFFKDVGEFAARHNVVFAIEANPLIYGGNFILSTDEALFWVKKTNLASVKINYDLGTVIENNESIFWLEENLKYINHIHISEPYLLPIKEREIHRQIFNILNGKGYDGWVSIEMKESEDEIVERTIDYIKEVFKK